jgi:hypothetical protein
LRGKSAHPPASDTIRDALAADLLRALEKGDSAAEELNVALTALLVKVDGFNGAIEAAQGDLRSHLLACFTELIDRQRMTLAALRDVGVEQRRQGRALRRQAALLEEMATRLRRIDHRAGPSPMAAPHSGPPESTAPARPPVMRPVVVVPPDLAQAPPASGWRGGADIVIGNRAYLLYDRLLEVRPSSDHALIHRQAQGQRLSTYVPPEHRYAWLRQAEMRRNTPGAAAALAGLAREHDLLRTLGAASELPLIDQFDQGRTTTLVVAWPASRATGVACEALHALLDHDDVPLDSWRLSRLCEGLAELCLTLDRLHRLGVAHRCLTPSGIIMLDNGRLVLRDLGLAACDPEPGEGPAGYQTPEQRRRRMGRPGAATDVYQIGAVVYHLATGRAPHPASPPPVRAQAPEMPESLGLVVDAALVGEAAKRPSIHQLGDALRNARRGLSWGS